MAFFSEELCSEQNLKKPSTVSKQPQIHLVFLSPSIDSRA
jgi:hypothetical protein